MCSIREFAQEVQLLEVRIQSFCSVSFVHGEKSSWEIHHLKKVELHGGIVERGFFQWEIRKCVQIFTVELQDYFLLHLLRTLCCGSRGHTVRFGIKQVVMRFLMKESAGCLSKS